MKALLSIWAALCFFAGQAQLNLTATADTNKILIGEQFDVRLTATVPEGTSFTWPLPDSLVGLEVIRATKVDTALKGDLWELTQTLTLSAFDSGYFAFPPQPLSVGEKVYYSEAIPVAVFLPELSEDQEFFDIKDPLGVPWNWWFIALLVAGLLVLIAGGIWGYRYFQKHKNPVYTPPEKAIPPYEWAIGELKKIENKQLWQKGKLKAYYSAVTDVLRQYMERALALNAMESTAHEIGLKLEHLVLSNALQQKVKEALHTSEMVKFAKEHPVPAVHEQTLETAYAFLEATKPKEEVPA